MSTLYFAAAIRDNGSGAVIGSEKVATGRRNLAEAGLADPLKSARATRGRRYAISAGRSIFVLIDGWAAKALRSRAR